MIVALGGGSMGESTLSLALSRLYFYLFNILIVRLMIKFDFLFTRID